MMAEYIDMAMRDATFESLEDGTVYGEIPGFRGVWSEGDTISEARQELREVLQEWIELRLPKGRDIPKVDGIDVNQLV